MSDETLFLSSKIETGGIYEDILHADSQHQIFFLLEAGLVLAIQEEADRESVPWKAQAAIFIEDIRLSYDSLDGYEGPSETTYPRLMRVIELAVEICVFGAKWRKA